MFQNARAKLLIVDDSEDTRALIAHCLASSGHELLFASNGCEALELLESSCIDLVITDIRMPVMSGLVLLETSRASGWQLPFIILSQTDDKHDVVRALRSGAVDFLEKPYRAEELTKAVEEALADHMIQARSSAFSQIAAGVAHEINNPVMISSLWIDQLKAVLSPERSGEKNQAQVLDLVSKIENASKRIHQIVGAVRSLSSGARGEDPELVNVADLVRESVELIGAKLRATETRVRVSADLELLTVYCRPSELLQVFVNLMSNACDAVGGQKTRDIEVSASALSDGRVAIRFTDSGPGVPLEVRDRIFRPLTTSKTRGAGSGIGLNISKRLVDRNYGRIFLDLSSPATCFCVELPAFAPAARCATVATVSKQH